MSGQPRKRGFANLSPEQLKAVSARGGKSPHRIRKGFQNMTPEKHKQASRRGGRSSRQQQAKDNSDGQII